MDAQKKRKGCEKYSPAPFSSAREIEPANRLYFLFSDALRYVLVMLEKHIHKQPTELTHYSFI